MARFKVAYLPNQGLILALVNPRLGMSPPHEQEKAIGQLQSCAVAHRMRGTVVPVWQSDDTFEYLAPGAFHAFLSNLTWFDVLDRVNAEMSDAVLRESPAATGELREPAHR